MLFQDDMFGIAEKVVVGTVTGHLFFVMAVVLPVILIGAPIGYFTWASVFDHVDHQAAKLCSTQSINTTVTNSWPAALLGSAVGLGGLSKAMFTPATRHRLFFAKAPPNTNIRKATLMLGLELLFRGGTVFYGAAASGAMAGRLAVCHRQEH